MGVLSKFFSTIGAIHVNAGISISMFLMNNLTMILVVSLVGYIAYQEFKSHEYDFIQDKRKIM